MELDRQTAAYWQAMEKWEHHHTHAKDIDREGKGYEQKALPHEERFPPCHPSTWVEFTIEEHAADPELETSRSAMSSTHQG